MQCHHYCNPPPPPKINYELIQHNLLMKIDPVYRDNYLKKIAEKKARKLAKKKAHREKKIAKTKAKKTKKAAKIKRKLF